MNPLLATQNIVLLIQALKYNQKAYTASTLAKKSGVDVSFTKSFIQALYDLEIFKFKESPSGRLINYRLNPYSKNIYYYDSQCIIKSGRTITGVYNTRDSYYDNYIKKYETQDLPDEAHAEGKILVAYRLGEEQLVELLMVKMQLHEEGTLDVLPDFPQVKAHLNLITKKLEQLKSEVLAEEKSNQDRKKWFEEETYKAKTGQRQRVVSYRKGRQIGTSTVSRKVSVSYWFDDRRDEWEYEKIPEYEFIPVMGPDYPEEPQYSTKMAEKNKYEITKLTYDIEQIKKYPMKYEKILQSEFDKNQKLADLEKEKSRIEAEYKRIKYG